jgi:cyclophilin family peptidyl-prolyl cis-trans isomerase
MQKNYLPLIIALPFVAVLILLLLNSKSSGSQKNNVVTQEPTTQPTPSAQTAQNVVPQNAESGTLPPMQIDTTKTYTAVIATSAGTMTVQLNAAQTPITVNNFVTLAKKGFYDNTIFHRVIKGFMIQGGDPTGTGMGGPGYKFDDEPFTGDYTRGTLAMANSGPNTNGSQFFIMHQDTPLPKNYVIFGKLVDGFDTLDKIAEAPVVANPDSGEVSKPVNPVKILSIQITEK